MYGTILSAHLQQKADKAQARYEELRKQFFARQNEEEKARQWWNSLLLTAAKSDD